MNPLTSRDNPHYRRLARLLRDARTRREQHRIVLDGAHLLDAYAQRFGLDAAELMLRASSVDKPELLRWREAVEPARVRVLADSLFDAVAPVDAPTGMLAIVPMPQPRTSAGNGFSILLDGIQDPGNLGAILRSAAAAGACDVFISSACADPWSPRCLRGGMGGHFLLAIHDRQDLLQIALALAPRLVAADLGGAQSLFDAPLARDAAFLVGAEGKGIAPALLAHAAQRVRIPMADGIESLNAATAATLLFYEWRRRHR